MMKKIFFAAFLVAFTLMPVNAQNLYKTVYNSAVKVVNDPNSSQEQIEINQFEVTVLNYLNAQVQKRAMVKDTYFYDSQAVNLKSFVDDFIYYVTKARAISTEKRKEVIACYRDASLNNPLFNDNDKERTYCYVNDTKLPRLKLSSNNFFDRHHLIHKCYRYSRLEKTRIFFTLIETKIPPNSRKCPQERNRIQMMLQFK